MVADPPDTFPAKGCNAGTRTALPCRLHGSDLHGRDAGNSWQAWTVRRESTTSRWQRVTVRDTRPAGGSCFSVIGVREPRPRPRSTRLYRVGLIDPTDRQARGSTRG